jgi:hypothetical protein
LKTELSRDGQLLAELVVAEKLGYTLNELRERIVPEELQLWLLFYELRADEEKKQLEQAKRRRR